LVVAAIVALSRSSRSGDLSSPFARGDLSSVVEAREIRNRGLCLHAEEEKPGSPVTLKQCSSSSGGGGGGSKSSKSDKSGRGYSWHYDSSVGLVKRHPGELCLDAAVPSKEGSALQLWPCRWSERWRVDHSSQQLQSLHGLCLNGDDSSSLTLEACDTDRLQQVWTIAESWAFVGRHRLQHLETALCLDGSDWPYGTMRGCEEARPGQLWEHLPESGQWQATVGTGSKMCLHLGQEDNNESYVQLSPCGMLANMESQPWFFHPDTSHIRTSEGLCLVVHDINQKTHKLYPMKNIGLRECDDEDPEQRWSVDPATETKHWKVLPKWNETSLYCFAYFRPDTAEEDLVRSQAQQGVGIFECDEYGVYAGENVTLGKTARGEELSSIAVDIRGSDMGDCETSAHTVCNALTFLRIWSRVVEEGSFLRHAWTVKVDFDAVFFPNRLRALLDEHTTGVARYVWNLKCWSSIQFLGPLEILSRAALEFYDDRSWACVQHLNWRTVGEDLFMQECLDYLKVPHVDLSGILSDNSAPPGHDPDPCAYVACTDQEKVAFHHFKTPKEWDVCHHQSLHPR